MYPSVNHIIKWQTELMVVCGSTTLSGHFHYPSAHSSLVHDFHIGSEIVNQCITAVKTDFHFCDIMGNLSVLCSHTSLDLQTLAELWIAIQGKSVRCRCLHLLSSSFHLGPQVSKLHHREL